MACDHLGNADRALPSYATVRLAYWLQVLREVDGRKEYAGYGTLPGGLVQLFISHGWCVCFFKDSLWAGWMP